MEVVAERIDMQHVLESHALFEEFVHQHTVVVGVAVGPEVRKRVHVGTYKQVRDANLEEHDATKEVLAHVYHLFFIFVVARCM
jgi:hypothetical protein